MKKRKPAHESLFDALETLVLDYVLFPSIPAQTKLTFLTDLITRTNFPKEHVAQQLKFTSGLWNGIAPQIATDPRQSTITRLLEDLDRLLQEVIDDLNSRLNE